MSSPELGLYAAVRFLIGLALGFYFRRLERFHAERVPQRGPILFTSNHPNSLTDSFVIGAAVPRKVHFVATVQLFRFKPIKWLLTQCGVIPINRVRDDPRAMRTVADTFEACYRVLERGEAIGIFPEGITYNDSQLKEIKSGAARMALELEERHQGKLGLKIVPVGLTFSAKEMYRSDALVHFGEPIRVADFLDGYGERRKECIHRLTAEIEQRIQTLIVHLPQLDHARLIEAVHQLYLDRLRSHRNERDLASGSGLAAAHSASQTDLGTEEDGRQATDLRLRQRIVTAVEQVYRSDPERASRFCSKLDQYQRSLRRLRVTDRDLALFPNKERWVGRSLAWALAGVIALPVALYGWIHRWVPYLLVRWAVRRFTEPGKRQAQTATAAIEAGIVAFGLCYGLFIFGFHRLFGWPASLWYALSLPVASLLAHYYLREVRKMAVGMRNIIVLLRAPIGSRRLIRLRSELIAEIEQAHRELAPA